MATERSQIKFTYETTNTRLRISVMSYWTVS